MHGSSCGYDVVGIPPADYGSKHYRQCRPLCSLSFSVHIVCICTLGFFLLVSFRQQTLSYNDDKTVSPSSPVHRELMKTSRRTRQSSHKILLTRLLKFLNIGNDFYMPLEGRSSSPNVLFIYYSGDGKAANHFYYQSRKMKSQQNSKSQTAVPTKFIL